MWSLLCAAGAPRLHERREAHNWPEVARGEEGGALLPPLGVVIPISAALLPGTVKFGVQGASPGWAWGAGQRPADLSISLCNSDLQPCVNGHSDLGGRLNRATFVF